MSTYVPAPLRRLVASRAGRICEYCLIHEEDTFLGCQVEHIISEKHGGESAESNLAFACIFCNRYKGTDIATLSPATHTLCRLFNPRTDRWADHFRLKDGRVEGISDIGQATAGAPQVQRCGPPARARNPPRVGPLPLPCRPPNHRPDRRVNPIEAGLCNKTSLATGLTPDYNLLLFVLLRLLVSSC